MKKFILMAFFFVALMAIPLAAQTNGTMFDPAVVDVILAGIGGLTVLAITQLVKGWLKASGPLAIGISGAVSVIMTAVYLVRAGAFTLPALIGYSVLVFAAANGIYKAKTA
jgi:hypothetical protein